MNKKKAIILIVLFFLASIASYWTYHHYYNTQDTPLTATGTIEATSVELTAKVSGTIGQLYIDEGNLVEKDQLVGELIRNDLLAQKERDSLSVMAAQARLQELQSGARSPEIEQAAAEVSIARINLDQAEQDLSRLEALYQAGALAAEEYGRMQAKVEISKNQLQMAEARLKLLQAGTRPEQITAAVAELEKTRAVLAATEAMVADLKIISPLAGTVISKNYEIGEYVPMGAALATVADLGNLWIKVFVPTDDLPKVSLGQKVRVTVSGSNQPFYGKVGFISSKGEFTPKTIQTKEERTNVVFAVKIFLEDGRGVLKPGMPADVIFDQEEKK
ncbi:MAG: HlyD family secretion protein [Syntrophomonadaceae bacterium]|jgi:HlyD family secretion protein